MRKVLPVLALLLLQSLSVHAGEDDLEALYGNLSSLDQQIDSTVDSVQARIGANTVPVYLASVQKLLERTEQSRQALHAVVADFKRQVTDLEEKGQDVSGIHAQLSRNFSRQFQNALMNAYTLDGLLLMDHASFRVGKFITCTGLLAFGLVPGMMCFSGQTNLFRSGLYSAKDNFGRKTWSGIALKSIQDDQRLQARDIFYKKSLCTTSGCVYLMAEYYKPWMRAIRDLNQTYRLGSGIRLSKIKLPSGRSSDHLLDLFAELATQ